MMNFLKRLFGLEPEKAPDKAVTPRRQHDFGAQAAAEGYDFGSMEDVKKDNFSGKLRTEGPQSGEADEKAG